MSLLKHGLELPLCYDIGLAFVSVTLRLVFLRAGGHDQRPMRYRPLLPTNFQRGGEIPDVTLYVFDLGVHKDMDEGMLIHLIYKLAKNLKHIRRIQRIVQVAKIPS